MSMRNYYISELMDKVEGTTEEKTVVFDILKRQEEDNIHKLCIVTEATGEYSANEILNNLEQLDSYEVEYSVHNNYDLGRYWIENMVSSTSENARYLIYIDYEWLGKDLQADGVGTTTPYGILWDF